MLFDAINESINDPENKQDLEKALKNANGIFAFVLQNKAGETETWTVDLKETGKVSQGLRAKPDSKELLCKPGRRISRANHQLHQ